MNISLFEIQKKIYQSMKQRALSYEIPTNELIKKYKNDQDYFSKRDCQQVHKDQLFDVIERSDVCFLGDFHTFDQSARNLLRILKVLARKNKKISIGLEMIHANKQDILNSYLEGDLTDLEFLEEIDYTESWRFPWSHYKTIFDFAKNNKIPIVALNSIGSLEVRDFFASKIINKNLKDTSMLVLFGELHILPNKLPQTLKDEAEDNLNISIIHQNMDSVYWESMKNEEEIDDFRLMKFNDWEYCIISSPPWMKYESVIYWYEGLMSDYEFDLHQVILGNDQKFFTENPLDKYLLIRSYFTNYLDLDDDNQGIGIYDLAHREYLETEIDKIKNNFERDHLLFCLKNKLSFYWVAKNRMFCSHYSVNHIAKLIGLELGWSKINNLGLFETVTSDTKNFFVVSLYIQILQFICVRVLNPFYKCDLYLDYDFKKREDNDEEARVVLDILNNFSEFLDTQVGEYNEKIFNFIESVGQVLGDHFFTVNKIDQEHMFGSDLRILILDNIESIDSCYHLIETLLSNKLFKMKKKRAF